MIRFILHRVAKRLAKRLDATSTNAAFAALSPSVPAPQLDGARVHVAALQVLARQYKSAGQFVADVDSYLRTAAQDGAQLVCFPELFGLLPLTLSPLFRLVLGYLTKQSAPPAQEDAPAEEVSVGWPGGLTLAELLHPFGFMAEWYQTVMARFARRYGVYLSAGTTFVEENGRVYNRHTLYSPDGVLLGQQDKIHLVIEEHALGMAQGDTLTVVPTPIGNIALMVCMDATYFETFRVAKALGADYAIVPIGNSEEYNEGLASRGAQTRVSETGLTAIKSALVSKWDKNTAEQEYFPLQLTGKAGIYYPLQSGLQSVEVDSLYSEKYIGATLALPALRDIHSDVFCLHNPKFDERYYNALLHYKNHAACGGGNEAHHAGKI